VEVQVVDHLVGDGLYAKSAGDGLIRWVSISPTKMIRQKARLDIIAVAITGVKEG
jgi:hypothetical protein